MAIPDKCQWCGAERDHTERNDGFECLHYACKSTYCVNEYTLQGQWDQSIWCRNEEVPRMPQLKGPDVHADIENRYTYHPPFGSQVSRYGVIRDKCRELAHLIANACPDSRERATSLTHLDICMMMANASIARNEKQEPIIDKGES